MKVLVLGASGATGKLVVRQLLKRNYQVRIVIRSTAKLPDQITGDGKVEIIKGNIYDFNNEKIEEIIKDCNSIICCLGHNINLKGIFGHPRKLVSNTIIRIIEVLQSLNINPKFILMSTTAYTNKMIGESDTIGEKIIFALLKLLLPPHKDNMLAADYLIYKLGTNTKIHWAAVRPDSLFDEENVSNYEISNCKLKSPIFNPGKTSRINVSDFMAELISNDELWKDWDNKTPVIYNRN
jgi:nucleoside-diphosphate-sugar epimerase